MLVVPIAIITITCFHTLINQRIWNSTFKVLWDNSSNIKKYSVFVQNNMINIVIKYTTEFGLQYSCKYVTATVQKKVCSVFLAKISNKSEYVHTVIIKTKLYTENKETKQKQKQILKNTKRKETKKKPYQEIFVSSHRSCCKLFHNLGVPLLHSFKFSVMWFYFLCVHCLLLCGKV